MKLEELMHIENYLFGHLRKEYKLSRTDVYLIMICKKYNFETYYDIKNNINIDSSLISKRLTLLESRGYIKRENEKKKKIITLTDKTHIVFEILEKIKKMEEKL